MSTRLSCDCCGDEIPPDAPMATLEVLGPEVRDEARPLGDYCTRCWPKIAAALDVLEQLGRRSAD
jgi:hypothetical protein